MKEMLYLCGRNVHFSFNNNVYIKNYRISIESSLSLTLANTFLAECQMSLIPCVASTLNNWKRKVDVKISFIEADSIVFVPWKLNSFHENIQFTFELEKEGRISFLNVIMFKDKSNKKQQYLVSQII